MAKGNEILLKLRAENKELTARVEESEKKILSLQNRIKKMANSSSNVLRKLGGVIGTYLGFRTISQLTNLAGEVTSVTESFYSLASAAKGGAEGLLNSLRIASKGTVDNLSIMRTANLAFQLMGEDVAKHLPNMMEIAMATAKAQGKKTADMFNDIVVASGRRSIMILDNLGISSAVASRYQDEFAKKLGKTRDKLTETEKSQAFFYATMKAGNEIMKKVGDSALTFGQRLQRLKAGFENTKQGISLDLIPALESLDIAFSSSENKGFSFLRTISRVIFSLIAGFSYMVTIIKASVTGIIVGFAEMGQAMYKTFGDMMYRLADSASKFPGIGKSISQKFETMGDSFYDYLEKNKNATDGMKENLNQYKIDIAKIEKKIGDIWDDSSTKQMNISKNLNASTRQRTKELANAAKKRAQILRDSEYYAFLNMQREADLAKERERYEKIIQAQNISQEQRVKLLEAHNRHIIEIQKKHNFALAQTVKSVENAFGSMYSSFESATKKAIKESLFGSGGWNDWRNQMKEIMQSFVSDLLYATAKAIALKAIVGGVTGTPTTGTSGIIGNVISGFFEKGYIPSFKKGRIPVFQGGTLPQNHFPAFIGKDEFVMNGRTSRNNYDLLRYMQENSGQSVAIGGATNNYYFTGNIMDEDYIRGTVLPTLETEARYQNKEVFSSK